MSDHFDNAVIWLVDQLGPVAEAGFLVVGKEPWVVTRDEVLVRIEIGYWHFDVPQTPNILSEEQSWRLFELCETRRGAFDFARHSAASYIQNGWTLPGGLQAFSVQYLGGQLNEPKIGRIDKHFGRKFLLYMYCRWAEILFCLKLTRGDNTPEQKSACDAVQEALSRVGVAIGFRAIKDICAGTHDSERQLREWVEEKYFPTLGEFWSKNQFLLKETVRWNKPKFPVMTKKAE